MAKAKRKPSEPRGIRVVIRYKTRDIGYGVEEGYASAYVTDDIDVWGKRTILVEQSAGEFREWFLFPDEWTIDEERGNSHA